MKSTSSATMEDVISKEEQIIGKWDVHGSKTTTASLFHDDRTEAQTFLAAVALLNHAMSTFASGTSFSKSRLLSRAHKLVESAMARLQKELHQILAADHKDSADEWTDDLRSIAESMVACGYTKECVKVYINVRVSVVEEGLHRLGHVRQSTWHVHKLDSDAAERQIRNWVAGSRPAVRTLFAGERSLCDYVFGASENVKELVFSEVAKDSALQFLRFPEMVASKRKISPEKVFQYLDLYDAISELLPEIESLFSYQSTAAVPSQARSSLEKLGDFIRSSLTDFESAIEKDWSKVAIPGGALHPMTRYVMNYLSLLADYGNSLGDILSDQSLLPSLRPLPEPFVQLISSPVNTAPSSPSRLSDEEWEIPPPPPPAVVTSRVAWLILLSLCKIDAKAEMYKDAALSYLFLANNVRYAVNKVRTSNLRHVLGEDWVRKNEEKVRAFTRGYEKMAWKKVVEAIPAAGKWDAEAVAEFNAAFEEAYRRQIGWVVTDKWMREELKLSIAGKVMGPYRDFYVSCSAAVAGGTAAWRFTPDDIGNYLSDLFHEMPSASGSSTSSKAGSSRSV